MADAVVVPLQQKSAITKTRKPLLCQRIPTVGWRSAVFAGAQGTGRNVSVVGPVAGQVIANNPPGHPQNRLLLQICRMLFLAGCASNDAGGCFLLETTLRGEGVKQPGFSCS